MSTENTYPIPESPHPDWARFLAALWFWGLTHPDQAQVEAHLSEALLANLRRTTQKRPFAPAQVRPSALLSCQRQAYLLLKTGQEPEPMPDTLAPSFAVGHLIEAMSRAYLYGALPPGFALTHDTRVPLPAWWPKGHPRFAELGTNDFTIRVTDPALAALYLDLSNCEAVCVFDCKTMGQIPYDTLKKSKSMADKPDGFGYNSQLTVYGAGSPDSCDTVLMGFNRNSPTQGVAVRQLTHLERVAEGTRLREGVEMALEGVDPGYEFIRRWNQAGKFYCTSFCSMRLACQSTPVEGAFAV